MAATSSLIPRRSTLLDPMAFLHPRFCSPTVHRVWHRTFSDLLRPPYDTELDTAPEKTPDAFVVAERDQRWRILQWTPPMKNSYVPIIFAWVVLLALVVATLGPIGIRPSLGLPLKVERFMGFAIVAALFTWAYPRRWIAILVLAVALAIGLEALQLVAPTRDASSIDAIVKVAGAASGVLAVRFLQSRSRGQQRP